MTEFTTALDEAKTAFSSGGELDPFSPGVLYLHRFDLHHEPLIKLGRRHRLPHPGEDMGYLVHAAMASLFGDLAPRTFSITHQNRGIVQVLGYSEHEQEKLVDHVSFFATPEAAAICPPSGIQSKRMPARWRPSTVLGFRTRVCPTIRLQTEQHNHRRRAEVDAFLEAQWQDQEATRPAAYRSWLERAMGPAVKLLLLQLDNCCLESVVRRTHERERRAKQGLKKPSASFTGALEILDGELFARLLARGIGRHRAFGLGMLLLHPWRA